MLCLYSYVWKTFEYLLYSLLALETNKRQKKIPFLTLSHSRNAVFLVPMILLPSPHLLLSFLKLTEWQFMCVLVGFWISLAHYLHSDLISVFVDFFLCLNSVFFEDVCGCKNSRTLSLPSSLLRNDNSWRAACSVTFVWMCLGQVYVCPSHQWSHCVHSLLLCVSPQECGLQNQCFACT